MKKIIALLILTFMVGSLLVGCVNKNKKPDPEPTPTPDHSPESEEKGEEEGKDNDGSSEEKNETEEKEEEETPESKPENRPTPYDFDDTTVSEPEGSEPAEEPKVIGTEIGNAMKAVTLERIDGQGTVSIEDFEGKIVIFNIWASWCGPCVSELPEFSEFADDYAEDVVIIAAHTSTGNANAYSYVKTNFKDSNIIFAYDTATNEAYFAAGGDGYVPYTVVLDRNGVIVYSDSGALSYDQLKAFWEQYK